MKKNKVFETAVHGVFLLLGLITVGCVLLITVYLIVSGLPAIREIGLKDFLFGQEWASTAKEPKFGILPFILTSVYGTAGAIVIGVPVGFFTAVYLSKLAGKRVRAVMESAVSLLAGIPSVVYGLVGMLVFSQTMGFQTSLLSGCLTLVIMVLPTIIRTTQESLKTVPQSYREGAFGLGAGKWRTIRTVVLPGCVDGVITGCILAVGRILGETAALLYTAGFAHTLYSGLRETLESSGATLSVALYVYAKEQGEFEVAFAIAAILMVLALLINLAATLTGRYFKKRRSL
mgnify:CR=1 FL=1